MRPASILMIAACGLAVAPALAAQRPGGAAAGPQAKGVWEPVSYPEDLALTDVFFVTPDVGWVSGAGGTILHTRDAGVTWTAQLGGDPGSSDAPISNLRFLDEHHGWATQGNNLLHTTDGESWAKIGAFGYEWGDYVFTTPQVGLYVRKNEIHLTRDGGRTWRPVFTCQLKVAVQGLTREVGCTVTRVHFPTVSVGYAVTSYVGEKGQFALIKTTNGGATWTASLVTGTPVQYGNEVLFLDEQRGLVAVDGTVHVTADGGRTWKGVVGSVGPEFRFADPEVGWSITRPNMMSQYLAYTVDGGKRWTTRQTAFPAVVHAVSLPRRDRAFAVGEHGMIYRYRVLAASDAVPDGALPAPAMPVFDSPLDEGVETVDEELEALEEQMEAAAEEAETEEDTSVVFVEDCCAESVNELQAAVDAVTPLLPPFLAKYRNVNLVVAGLQLLGVLPDQLAQVKAALQNVRRARGTAAAVEALTQLNAAVDALKGSARQAFQQEPLELEGEGTGDPADGAEAVDADVAEAPADSASPSAAEQARRKAAEEAKRRVNQAKKKIRVRIP